MSVDVERGDVRPASVLDAVVAATPLVRAARHGAEQRFRLAPEVLDALGSAGVFRHMAPREHGGAGVSVPESVRIHEELAYGDPSVAWASANSNGVGRMLARIDPASVPDVILPSVRFYGVGLPVVGRAEVTDGGYVVTGRWPVVSGSADADWFALNCVVHEGGAPRRLGDKPDVRGLLVPASAATVEDTWRGVVAVRGSGSNAVAVDGAFVPERHSTSPAAPPLFPSPADVLSPPAAMALILAAIATGIGRAAVEAAVDQAATRVSLMSGQSWIDWPAVQNTVASADTAIEATRAALFALSDRCWDEAGRGALDRRTHARLYAMADHAFRTVRHAVSDLFTVGSVDALREGHGLEQALRDVHGFSVQWERNRRYHYEAGRALLGGTPADPAY